MTRITGQQARELLAGTTPGPWMHSRIDEMSWIDSVPRVGGHTVAIVVKKPEDANLLAAAPSLAETVAWLYGAEGQDGEFGWRRWPLGGSWSVGLRDGQISIGPEGGGLGFRTPEDAEEAAVALLAAAEEARRDDR